MSHFREYTSYTPPIDFWTTVRTNNGNPDNSADIRVSVYDSDDNSEILNEPMPVIGNTGYYKYAWRPTFTQDKILFATVYIAGSGQRRTVIDTIYLCINQNKFLLEEKVDENDGIAI